MRGNERVTDALNELLTLELTVVNQYFVHSKMCENWGYARLAAKLREIALEEMRDAEEIIDRILFLDGVPNMQRLGSVTVGETVPEQFRIALEGEHRALEAAQRAYPVRPKGPDDTWWMPAHLGGTAPTPEQVRQAEAH